MDGQEVFGNPRYRQMIITPGNRQESPRSRAACFEAGTRPETWDPRGRTLIRNNAHISRLDAPCVSRCDSVQLPVSFTHQRSVEPNRLSDRPKSRVAATRGNIDRTGRHVWVYASISVLTREHADDDTGLMETTPPEVVQQPLCRKGWVAPSDNRRLIHCFTLYSCYRLDRNQLFSVKPSS